MKTLQTIQLLLAIVMLPLGTLALLPSCSTTTGYVQTAQSWLADPKNQQLIQDIAGTAISILGVLGAKPEAAHATVVDKLAADPRFQNVPAGALRQIASHPHSYAATR